MTARVLHFYIARRFAASVALILASVLAIIFLVDLVELVRRLSDREAFTPLTGLTLAAMRAPALLEEILPFAFLFGAVLSLLSLSRRLELVIARSIGLSAWGFLAPAFAVALAVGLLSTFVLNPLAGGLKTKADRIEAELAGVSANKGEGAWFRQESVDGSSIVHARTMDRDSLALYAATAYVFAPDGRFREKAEAPLATYRDGRWTFHGATLATTEGAPQDYDDYVLPTDLSAEEVSRVLARPDILPIWALADFIGTAAKSGLDADRFRVAYHALLARPLFLLAMVGIAACVSLRLTRLGGSGRLVLAGVAAGFLLYVVTKVMGDLGGNGIVNAPLAAWAPSILALTAGATILLRQEDG